MSKYQAYFRLVRMTYTQLTVISVIFTILLDLILKTGILKQKKFWWFILAVILLQTVVDNYLNGRWLAGVPIVGPYGKEFYSGIRVWHTPLENYFFGFSLITCNIVVFEKLKSLWKLDNSQKIDS